MEKRCLRRKRESVKFRCTVYEKKLLQVKAKRFETYRCRLQARRGDQSPPTTSQDIIGKGKTIAHTRASMAYGWNQEKNAEVIFRQHLVGESPSEITQEFRFVLQQNDNCKKNALSFVLSPTIEDG